MITGNYVEVAAARLGRPVLAAAMFRRFSTPMLGSNRLFAGLATLMSRTANRFGSGDVPRRFMLAVTDTDVHLLPVGRVAIGEEAAAWSRDKLQVVADFTRRGVELLIQPPGDRPAIECLGVDVPTTRALVAALTETPPPGGPRAG